MAKLSMSLAKLQPRYDAVVIGSGYGGAIAAATLARARRDGQPLQVALLERGEEIATGQFPDDVLSATSEFQIDHPGGSVGDTNGLYHVHVDDDITVIQGCGLGGTSLINANVSLEPEARVWDDPVWPSALRADAGRIAAGFENVRAVLRPTPYPDSPEHPRLPKYDALEQSAKHMGAPVYHPPINVTFHDVVNPSGVAQSACTGCGDCVSGCNFGAKNTLMTNYLPEARNDGAHVFCGVSVVSITRDNDNWAILWEPAGVGREEFDAPPLRIECDIVVVAAGSLGSTKLLLRSKARGLAMSDRVGSRFTGNGDVLGFGYNCDRTINGIGIGPDAATTDRGDAPGPTITGAIDLRNHHNLVDGIIIEEGALPSSLGPALPVAFAAAAAVLGDDTDEGLWDGVKEKLRSLESIARGSDEGAVNNTQTYLVMAHDDAKGVIELEDDRARIRWPGVGRQAMFTSIYEKLTEATEALGGTMIPSPLFNQLVGYDLVTVHPLGGCPMADRAEDGVVDDRGRVFSGTAGDEVHDGLYVLDGSIIPRPLGVNPLLTISALADRAAELLVTDRGWTLEPRPASRPQAHYDGRAEGPSRTRLWFTERLTGHVATGDAALLGSFEDAEAAGKDSASPCSVVVTISTDDIDHFVDDPLQQATAIGTVELPGIEDGPLTVVGGRFNLLVVDPVNPRDREMRYRLPLVAASGRELFLAGHKVVHDDPGIDPIADTTRLNVVVHEGTTADGPVVGRGMVRISVNDFRKQLGTLSARRTGGGLDLGAIARFGKLFAAGLWDSYGPGGPA